MKKSVSIIGVGNMGGGMALNLLARGYSVHVHDVDATKVQFLCQKGALALMKYAPSAIESILTIICVVDAQQTKEVLFGEQGMAASLPRGHTVMLCPTIAPQDVERFAEQLASLGIHVIDAPMSGGPARAQDGSMSLMVACADGVFAQHELLLRDLSSKLFRISTRPGDAARTKLVNNLLAASNLAAAAEAMALAERLGLDPSQTLDVIEQSSGQSWIGSDRMRRAIAGDFAPRAHVTLLAKDSRLALDMAQTVGFENPVGEQAALTFAAALQSGLGHLDDAALFQLHRANRQASSEAG
jgi:3-hydroxyisobutyrate dehydrogenase-like beta-hydroxyacid dehydrogenase